MNLTPRDASGDLRKRAEECLRAGRWEVGADEPHRSAVADGDLALIYLGRPLGQFVGCAELAAATADGVALRHVEVWDAPVAVDDALARIDPTENARADFDSAVVAITRAEYEIVLTLARRAG